MLTQEQWDTLMKISGEIIFFSASWPRHLACSNLISVSISSLDIQDLSSSLGNMSGFALILPSDI
jgi:hypothetical protein